MLNASASPRPAVRRVCWSGASAPFRSTDSAVVHLTVPVDGSVMRALRFHAASVCSSTLVTTKSAA